MNAHSGTSQSGAKRRCFVHFDLKMCFSLQRRAIFPHRNFKKWSEAVSFFNILTLKCASRYSGVQFFHIATSKSAWARQFFNILTLKCASRYSGVQFFHIATSKSGPPLRCFVHFDLKMFFSPQRRAIFPHRNFKKWSEHAVFCTF